MRRDVAGVILAGQSGSGCGAANGCAGIGAIFRTAMRLTVPRAIGATFMLVAVRAGMNAVLSVLVRCVVHDCVIAVSDRHRLDRRHGPGGPRHVCDCERKHQQQAAGDDEERAWSLATHPRKYIPESDGESANRVATGEPAVSPDLRRGVRVSVRGHDARIKAPRRLFLDARAVETSMRRFRHSSQIRPVRNSISNTTRITPTIPLGPYPHPLLCGQVGITPTMISTNTMRRIVPRLIACSQEKLEGRTYPEPQSTSVRYRTYGSRRHAQAI